MPEYVVSLFHILSMSRRVYRSDAASYKARMTFVAIIIRIISPAL